MKYPLNMFCHVDLRSVAKHFQRVLHHFRHMNIKLRIYFKISYK